MENNKIKNFNIGLASWIIQDGNYDDFCVGQTRKFALEFYPNDIRLTDKKNKSIYHVGDIDYEITGEIVYISGEIWIIDFGLLAYQEDNLPEGSKVGDYITGKIGLAIDYYIYFESYFALEGIPPLIYTWKIKNIFMETAPFIEENVDGIKTYVRDESKLGYKEIVETNAWNDDEGHASYILRCELEDIDRGI